LCGFGLEAAQLVGPVALCSEVDFLDGVEVAELDGADAHRGELEGHLPPDGPDPDDQDVGVDEVLGVDEA